MLRPSQKKEILHAVREFQNGKHMVHKRGNYTAFLLLQNAEVHTNNSWVGNMQQTAAIAFGRCCVLWQKKTTKKHYKNNQTHSNFCEPYWTDRKARGTSCKWFVPSVYGLDGSPPHMAAFLLLFGYVSSTETYLAVPSGRDGCDISGPGSPASAPAKGSVCHRSAVSARWCECATSYRCRRPCHIRSIGPIHWRCSRSLEIKREREISNIELIMQLHCYGYERVHIWIMISNEGWQQRLNGLSDTHHGTPWFCKSISRPVASHFRWPFCRNAGLCVKQIVHQCMQGSVRIYWCFVRWKLNA